jgi:hypothetical protein
MLASFLTAWRSQAGQADIFQRYSSLPRLEQGTRLTGRFQDGPHPVCFIVSDQAGEQIKHRKCESKGEQELEQQNESKGYLPAEYSGRQGGM